MIFLLPMNMILAEIDLWRGGNARRRQNRYLMDKVAGRDCLLSPIIVSSLMAQTACAPADSNITNSKCL